MKKIMKISKNQSRGDEVGLLFFLLIIISFLVISLIRFSIIGKVLDDFLFTFLFGWMKYFVYFLAFLWIVPWCFGYRLQFKFKHLLSGFMLLIISCWTTQTLSLLILEKNNLWTSYHNLNLLSITQQYVKTWWQTNCVNNYSGFFAAPITWQNFSVQDFFPAYATGGIISNVLTGIFNYGFFITNLLVNVISISSLFCLFVFNKPFIFISKIKSMIISIRNKCKKVNSNRALKQKYHNLKKEKLLIDKQVKKTFKQAANIKQSTKNEPIVPPSSPINKSESTVDNKNSAPVTYFSESSYLTPFGKINPEKQKDVISNSKGVLVVKKSLEDSILNQEIIADTENNNEAEINNIE